MSLSRSLPALAALAALAACSPSTTPADGAPPDLSKKAKVVTFDVSGMT